MSHRAAIIVTLLLMTLFIEHPHSVHSEDAPILSEKPDVKVSLAVVERGSLSATSTLHVIIQNISDKPQCHFDEWNSWGYGNLTLQWTDTKGKTGVVTKVRGLWTRNVPTATLLQPGNALVREISFDPKLWQGWPASASSITLALKVTYHSTNDPKIPASVAGWTGTVASKEQTVDIPRIAQNKAPEVNARANHTHAEWLAGTLKQITTIKPGMTRKDFEKIFDVDGGLASSTTRRYCYRECPCIKVDVAFEVVDGSKSPATDPEAKLTEVSKPFLEFPFSD